MIPQQMNERAAQQYENSIQDIFFTNDKPASKRKDWMESQKSVRPPPRFRLDTFNVTVEFEGRDGSKTLFKNKKVEYCSNDHGILIASLLSAISHECGLQMENHTVFYYSPTHKSQVFIGRYPLDAKATIDPQELPDQLIAFTLRPLPPCQPQVAQPEP